MHIEVLRVATPVPGATPRRWRARDPFSGYSHLAGLGVACVAAVVLVMRARHDVAARTTAAIYGACLVVLYAASSAYHLLPQDDTLRLRLRKLDHAAIFSMIAGTCTPVFWRAFTGSTQTAMLSAIWAVAALGVVFRLVWLSAPRALYTAVYMAMGWMFLVRGRQGFHALPVVTIALLLAGGIVYSLGAVVYALKRPDPFPSVFGFHEIWHLFVLVGSALHYAAVATLV